MKLTVRDVNLLAYFSLMVLVALLAAVTLLRGFAQYNNLGLICLILGILCFLVIDKVGGIPDQATRPRPRDVSTSWTSLLRVQLLPYQVALYAALMTAAGLSLALRAGLDRPTIFFIIIAALYAVIALEIATMAGKGRSLGLTFLVLLQIVCVGLLFNASSFIDVYQYTDDPGMHRSIAEAIATTGHTPAGIDLSHYGTTYLFHAYYAIASIVPNVNILQVSLIIISVESVSIFLLYALCGKFTENVTASLFAALLLSFFSSYIEYANVQTTLGFALVLILLVMLCVVSIYKAPQITFRSKSFHAYLFLGLLSFLALLLTHPEFSFACVLWVAFFAVAVTLYRQVRRGTRSAMRAPLTIVLLFLVMWTFAQIYSYNGIFLVGDVQYVLGYANIGDVVNIGSQAGLQPPVASYGAFFFANIGILLFYSFITAGGFLLLKSKKESHFVLAVWVGLNFLFTILGLAFGEVQLLFSRFYYFIGPIAAISGGYVIVTFLDTVRANKRRIFRAAIVSCLCLFIFGASFLSIASERSDLLDPIFHQSTGYYAFINTYGERECKNTVFMSLAPGSTITTDYPTVASDSVPNMSGSQRAPVINAAGEMTITYAYTLSKNGTNESTSYVITMFSNASLEQLNGSYDYVIINKYALERGMIFYGTSVDQSYGWKVDGGSVSTALSQHNKLFDSNILALYN